VGLLIEGSGQPWAGEDRPESWATAIGDLPGLSNLFKVSDELYRGAQPEEAGYAQLKKLGVKTVVSLRTFHRDRSDREACRKHGLRYVNITVQAWEPEDDEVIELLEVVTNPQNQPVFIHCKHGSDRTGMMSAIYRIAVQGWPKDEAIAEMTRGGFGFHSVWQNLVDYVTDLDVEKIKKRAGID
jgi:protein tyrosine/serine phosphatase